jgi:hypothetical protein
VNTWTTVTYKIQGRTPRVTRVRTWPGMDARTAIAIRRGIPVGHVTDVRALTAAERARGVRTEKKTSEGATA